ncbi:DUF4270 family protein [Mangrovibacterium lignilyticum]|uniref:DUF4270 family protein n=1 Tax=Mangrovibacterium lignilyticum TaxID=2668052 RepID=UPI0013D82543|nr:DUF4270 family protein [Mangrovibacterium lignilyticum]
MNKNWLLVFIIGLMASCNTDVGNFEIGQDLVESGSKIVMIDSFAVNLSTVLVDSLATSDPTSALVGKYSNPKIGTTELRHYFNVDLASDYASITEFEDVFDSITVKFNYSGFSIGDTITPVTFSLHRLTDELDLLTDANNLDYLYNTSSFSYDETPLGSYTIVPSPSNDSIEFKLDPALGEEIINWLWNTESINLNNDNFLTLLKGFVMTVSSDDDVILGFDNSNEDDIQLKLYTHVVDLTITENTYEFNKTTEGTSFNQSIADRSNTPFSGLKVQSEALPSDSTGNISYIQGTTGVLSRLDFPSIEKIFTLEDRVLIKAEIKLPAASENNYSDLPSSLNFYATNRFNDFSTSNVLSVTSSSGTTVSVSATLVSNYLTNEYYYVADITDYLQSELSDDTYDTNHGLFVGFTSTNIYNQAQLLILNAGSAKNQKPTLNLYFLEYE